MTAPTDDTVVDVVRPPLIDRCDEWGDPIPSAVPPDEDDEDRETSLLSRLPWPEPPRSLSEQPRTQEPLTAPLLSRSTGGVSRSVMMTGGVQHRAFWRGLGGTVFVAACLSVLLTRSRSKAPASPDPHALGAPAVSAAQRPALPPPLFITIGNVSRAAPATTKPSIDVTKLPVATPTAPAARQPRRASPPVVRNRAPSKAPLATSNTQRSTAPANPTASKGPVVDDGF